MPSNSESEDEIVYQTELPLNSEILKSKDKNTNNENIKQNEITQKYGFEINFKYRYKTSSRVETIKNINIIDLL